MKDNTPFHSKHIGCLLALFCLVFSTSAVQARDVTFTWTPNTEQVDSYNLYYKTGTTGGTPYNGTGLTEGDSPVNTGNVTTFTIHGLSDAETYFFVLTAMAGSLESDYSDELVLDPLPDFSGPGITATFSWLPNTDTNLAGYKIHYGTASGSYSTTVDIGNPTPVAGRIQTEVTGLDEGVTYYFAATAYDTAGLESDYSTEVVWTASSQSGGAPPIASNSSISTPEDQAVSGTTTASNDTGLPISYVIQQNVTHGVVLLESANGTYIYTPEQNFSGSDSFTFLASDDNGDSNAATVNITITAANDAPVAQSVSSSTDEDTAINGQLQAQDPDNDPLTYSTASNPANGTAVVNSDGTFTYTPNPEFSGTDRFTFTANDGQTTSPPAAVSITIAAINDPPTAMDTAFAATEDSALNGQLQGNDPDGDNLTYTTASAPAQGSLTITPSGSFTYTPNSNATGADSFSFQVSDGKAASDAATVTITINAVNDPPVVNDLAITINEDSRTSGQLQGQDPEGGSLTYTAVSNPSRGTLALDPSGSFTYTPNADVSGTDSFTFQASDGQTASNTATVSITIAAVNDPPTAENLTLSTTEGIPATGQLQAQDPDIGDNLTYIVASEPANGTLTLNSSGSFTYTANTGATTDNFTFQVSDGQATSKVATVSVNITPSTGITGNFSWLPNTEPNIAGYKIHYGKASAVYDTTLDIGNPAPINGRIEGQVEGLIEGDTYYFAVTAYNTDGEESDYSTEIVWVATSQSTPPPIDTEGNVTGIFGDTTDSNHAGTLADTFANTNDNINAANETVSTWSWASPAPHLPANTIIVKIDLSALPQDTQITEAKFYMYQTATHGETSYSNSIHKITGKNPTIDQVSGNNAFNGELWTPVAAGTTSNDVPLGLADIAEAEDTVTLDGQPGYKSWTVTRMIQDWVKTPTNNFGLLITGVPTAAETGRTFASSENQNASFRPKLVVRYIKKPPKPSIISARQIQ